MNNTLVINVYSSRSQIPFGNGLSLEVPLPAFPRVPGRTSNLGAYPTDAKSNFTDTGVPKYNLGTSLTSYERIPCPEGAASHSPRLRYPATLGACLRPDGLPQRGYVRYGRNPFRVVMGLGPCDPRVAAYRNPGLIDGIPLGFQRHFVPKCNLGTSLRVRHSRAGGNPVHTNVLYESPWIPACAGMTGGCVRNLRSGIGSDHVFCKRATALECASPACAFTFLAQKAQGGCGNARQADFEHESESASRACALQSRQNYGNERRCGILPHPSGWKPLLPYSVPVSGSAPPSRSQIPFGNGLSLEVPLPGLPRVPGCLSNPAAYPAVAKSNFANKDVPKWNLGTRAEIPFGNGLSLEVPLPAFPRVPGHLSNPAAYPAVAKSNFANKDVPKWNLGTRVET